MLIVFGLLQATLPAFVPANHSYGNLAWYSAVADAMRTHGLFAVWTPYPPVFPSLFYLLHSLSGSAAVERDVWRTLNVVLIAASALCMFGLVVRQDRTRALLVASGYVLINSCWTSYVTIGLFIDQFEYLPIFLLLAAALALSRGAPVSSASLCGIGALTKVFPGVVMLAAWVVLPRPWRTRYVAIALATGACIVLPFLICGTGTLVSSLQFTASRDGWETVWLFPRVHFPPIPAPALLVEPFRSAERPYAALAIVTGISLVGYTAWQLRAARRAPLTDQLLCSLLLMLIFAKGVSCYFIFWLFPLLLLCYPPLLGFSLCCLLLLLANLEFVEATQWSSLWCRHGLFVGLLLDQCLRQREP